MSDFIVPESFPPGHFIRMQMDARGWSQSDLAEILGVDNRVIHELVNAKRKVTPKTARALSDAFGNAPEEWLKLQMLHDLAKESLPTDNVRQRKAFIWNRVPVNEMIRLGWLAPTDNIAFLEAQVMRFMRWKNLEQLSTSSFAYAARQSSTTDALTKEQMVWLRRAMNVAESVPLKSRYENMHFADLLDELIPLRRQPEEARHVSSVLANHGIRFLIIEHTRGSKIDGVCFWFDDHAPVVALTMRYNRIDWFWFTLCHELGHVFYKHGRVESTVDTRLVGADAQPSSQKSKEEQKADNFAERFLINENALDRFISDTTPAFSISSIIQFAEENDVHPGIVVGRLQHMGKIPYRNGREMLLNIRHIVTETTITDGWGNSISI